MKYKKLKEQIRKMEHRAGIKNSSDEEDLSDSDLSSSE